MPRLSRCLVILAALFSVTFSLIPAPAQAALVPCGLAENDPETKIDETEKCTLCHVIVGGQGVIDWGLKIMTVVAITVIFAMALYYIVSSGNEGMMQTAKGGIKAALLGFALMLSAWLIVNVILSVLAKSEFTGLIKDPAGGAFTFTCNSTTGLSASADTSTCDNGTINPPTCNVCAATDTWDGSRCVADEMAAARAYSSDFPSSLETDLPETLTASGPPPAAAGAPVAAPAVAPMVAASATLSVTPSSCAILVGNRTCPVTLTWDINHASDPNVYNAARNIKVATTADGSREIWITNGPNPLRARNGTAVLATVTPIGSCVSGSTWNGTICAGGGGGASGTITASPTSCTIPSGGSTCGVAITWSITGAGSPNVYNVTRSLTIATSPAGTAVTTQLTHGANSIQARNGGTALDTVVATASCAPATTWNGTTCTTGGGGGGGSCPLTPAERGYVKFYTGHYVQWKTIDDTFINEIKGPTSGVRGAMKRYDWKDLEPTKDNYDFSKITTDMAKLKAVDKKLVAFIQFKYPSPPAYLEALTGGGVWRHAMTGPGDFGSSGWVAAFDNPIVRDQFIKMLKAMAASGLNNDTGLAAILFNETASSTDISGDVRTAFYTNLMLIDAAASCAFTHTPVIQFTNFLGPYAAMMRSSYLSGSVGTGGPDVLDPDPTLSGAGKSYEFIRSLHEELPIGMNVAAGNYWYNNKEEFRAHIHDTTPPLPRITHIADFGKTLHPNFMFWARYNEPAYKYYDAFLVRAAAGDLNDVTDSICPTAYGGKCTTP